MAAAAQTACSTASHQLAWKTPATSDAGKLHKRVSGCSGAPGGPERRLGAPGPELRRTMPPRCSVGRRERPRGVCQALTPNRGFTYAGPCSSRPGQLPARSADLSTLPFSCMPGCILGAESLPACTASRGVLCRAIGGTLGG